MSQGSTYNLQTIYARLNKRFFQGSVNASVRWGRALSQPPRQHSSITFGTYQTSERLITIHRRLDRRWVHPRFVEYVMFHEMLHQKHPWRMIRGRRIHHTPAFLAAEKRYKHYEWAMEWAEKNLVGAALFLEKGTSELDG